MTYMVGTEVSVIHRESWTIFPRIRGQGYETTTFIRIKPEKFKLARLSALATILKPCIQLDRGSS
jgi:hypothetical protein